MLRDTPLSYLLPKPYYLLAKYIYGEKDLMQRETKIISPYSQAHVVYLCAQVPDYCQCAH